VQVIVRINLLLVAGTLCILTRKSEHREIHRSCTLNAKFIESLYKITTPISRLSNFLRRKKRKEKKKPEPSEDGSPGTSARNSSDFNQGEFYLNFVHPITSEQADLLLLAKKLHFKRKW
jgi:hypothetical protein